MEKLAVGLTRDRVCVLSVPAPHAAAYARCLQTLGRELQARPPAGTAEAPGSRSLHFRAGGPGSALLDMVGGWAGACGRCLLDCTPVALCAAVVSA